jgi:hypothetical protein
MDKKYVFFTITGGKGTLLGSHFAHLLNYLIKYIVLTVTDYLCSAAHHSVMGTGSSRKAVRLIVQDYSGF